MRQKPAFPRNRNRRSAGFCIEIVSEDFLNPVPIRLTFVFLVGMILIAFLRAQISKSSPSKSSISLINTSSDALHAASLCRYDVNVYSVNIVLLFRWQK